MSTFGFGFGPSIAAFNYNLATIGLNKSIARLSSGSALADPSDDPAGLAVSSQFDASVKRLSATTQSVQVLLSLAQTSDGFLTTIEDQLTRMSELAARATNGAFSASDRQNYSIEFEQLTTDITNQVTNAKFNGAVVFDTAQPGTNPNNTVSASVSQDGTNTFTITLRNLTDDRQAGVGTGSLFGLGAMDITTTTGASAALGQLTTLLANVATDRANVNSDVSSLDFHLQNLSTEEVNTNQANSRIKDLDFAEESTTLAKYNILAQAGAAVLAQANTSLQNVLTLLR
jgi:flagellin